MRGPEGSFLCTCFLLSQHFCSSGWKLQNLTAVTWGFIFLVIPRPEGTAQGKNSRKNLDANGPASSRLPSLWCLCVPFMQAQTLYDCFSISGFPLAFLAGRMEGQGSVCVSGWEWGCKRNQIWPLLSYISLLTSHWLEPIAWSPTASKAHYSCLAGKPRLLRRKMQAERIRKMQAERMLAHYRLCQFQASDAKISQQ